jgi:hypothetical protein
MSSPLAIFEGFSISDAQILDGATTFDSAALGAGGDFGHDIYGVSEASLDPDTGDFQNEGDDVVLSQGYISFPLWSTLTGRTYSSSGTGNGIVYGMDLWHEDDQIQGAKPMVLRFASRDRQQKVRHATVGLYACQFKPVMFDGPKYKDGLKVNWECKALFSTVNELGVAFSDGKKRIAKVLSHA